MNLGDWIAAESELRRLIEKAPNHTMALIHQGTCLIAMNRAEQAERPLNEAIRIDPQHSDAWYQRGLLYLEFGRIDAARADFDAAAKYDPRHLDARLRSAAILHEEGDDEAATAWREVLDVDPEHRLARRRLQECADKTKTGVTFLPKD